MGMGTTHWVDPPLFRQCPKENVFFPLRPSLTHHIHDLLKGKSKLKNNGLGFIRYLDVQLIDFWFSASLYRKWVGEADKILGTTYLLHFY